jgi:hypothetical protein
VSDGGQLDVVEVPVLEGVGGEVEADGVAARGQTLGDPAGLSATAVGDKADFLAVDMDPRESPETVRGFLDHIKAPQLPATIDTGAALSRRFQVAALSTLIVIDPRGGKVTYRATDPTADQIKAELAKVGAQ